VDSRCAIEGNFLFESKKNIIFKNCSKFVDDAFATSNEHVVAYDFASSAMTLALLLLGSTGSASAIQPHIVFVMADDLGSNDVGWSDPTVLSPTIDGLAKTGIILSHLYAYKWCAPSRASFLTGRYVPMHGYESGGDGPKGVQGTGSSMAVPLHFKLLPQVLTAANYSTMMVGKYHLGYVTEAHTPEARGFQQYLGYLTGAEDYYTHAKTPVTDCGVMNGTNLSTTFDLWRGESDMNGTVTTSRPEQEKKNLNRYSIFVYNEFLVTKIDHHFNDSTSSTGAAVRPLFIYASFQNVHGPLEVPREYFDRYAAQGADVKGGANCLWSKYIAHNGGKGFACSGAEGANCYCNRLIVKAQVSALDDAVANLTNALKAHPGVWENTVLVFQGDNGGPTFEAHSNAPLRGGKLNFFEGGVRPAAFIHSPLLARSKLIGTTYTGILHTVDWFATFAQLAGAELPSGRTSGRTSGGNHDLEINGINMWPALLSSSSESSSSPPRRNESLISDFILRVGKWKLVLGSGGASTSGDREDNRLFLRDCTVGACNGGWCVPPSDKSNNDNQCCDVYTKPPKEGKDPSKYHRCPWDDSFPGTIAVTDPDSVWLCGPNKTTGPCRPDSPCLWDVVGDPAERNEVAKANPDVVKRLVARLNVLTEGFAPDAMATETGNFCKAAASRGGWCGPWAGF
jgi:arylsulfatase A-like enzyme